MEQLKHSKSRFAMKNGYHEHVMGIPVSSAAEYALSLKSSGKAFLPEPAAQYQLLPSPSNDHFHKFRHGGRVDSVVAKVIQLGQSMDTFAQRIREHVRLAPKISEAVKGKFSLGTRILQVGGVEKVFKQIFNVRDDEKLFKAFQCYLSTTAGPLAGVLFISNNRVAFCSDRPIKISSPTGKKCKLYYKVMIPLRKITRADEIENVKTPTQKYVQLVTEDNFDFWFMGFLGHQRTLKYLRQAIHQAR